MATSGLQHIQLPNDMTKSKKLTPNDLWVYICIKSFMNGKTKECFPSLKSISLRSDLSIPTIRESITLLVSENWISIKKTGRSQRYYFTPYKNFEVFSYSFLEKKDISTKEKAYLVASQQFMYKDVEGYGKISFSNDEIADKINLSTSKIEKYDKDLIDKGYLTLIDSKKEDIETGLFIKQKFFKLNELEQQIVFALQQHNDAIEMQEEIIENHESRITSTENSNKWLMKKLIEQQNELDRLRKLLSSQSSEILL